MRRKNSDAPEAAAPAGDASNNTTDTTPDATPAAPKTRARRSGQKTGKGRGSRAAGGAAGETGRLIEALLQSRGRRGASQADLEQIVGWAQSVRAESAAIESEAADLRKLGPRGGKGAATGGAATRQRQQRQERQRELEQRRQRNAMDQALLSGVLDGRIALDVQPEGGLLFLDRNNRDGAATEVDRGMPAG